MKIVLFVNSSKTFFWHRKSLADRLIQEGHDVHILCSDADDISRFKVHSYNAHFVQMSRKGRNPFDELKVLYRIYKLIKVIRPDVCHNFTIKCVIYGSLVQRILGVTRIINSITGLGIVFTRDNFFQKCIRSLYKFVFKFSQSKIIFQNPDDLKLFSDSHIISKKNLHTLILGSGVNTHVFTPGERNTGTVRVVFASRLLKSKGILELIKSSQQLSDEGLKHELLIAGEPDPMSSDSLSESDISLLRKQKNIQFLGNVTDMPALLGGCHIACFPSYYREGVPKFLIESASAGLAIITSDAPGCREVVEDNGIMVPVRDSDALTAALRSLIMDPERVRILGANSRTIATKKFSEELILKQIIDFYSL